jgi:hypothetical protein
LELSGANGDDVRSKVNDNFNFNIPPSTAIKEEDSFSFVPNVESILESGKCRCITLVEVQLILLSIFPNK